jgi:hypothetical protein
VYPGLKPWAESPNRFAVNPTGDLDSVLLRLPTSPQICRGDMWEKVSLDKSATFYADGSHVHRPAHLRPVKAAPKSPGLKEYLHRQAAILPRYRQ